MIARLLILAVAVWITAWLLPGVSIDPWWAALVVAVLLGLINTFIRPVVKLLALPLNIITLGLFSLVINALMVLLCAWIYERMTVDGFLDALWFSIVLTVVNWVLHLVTGKE
ncbi:MAG: phage holin family protein [Muribaculaceae bacterium]|nr:phage holin family protein [Muribaculaceae bacterium]